MLIYNQIQHHLPKEIVVKNSQKFSLVVGTEVVSTQPIPHSPELRGRKGVITAINRSVASVSFRVPNEPGRSCTQCGYVGLFTKKMTGEAECGVCGYSYGFRTVVKAVPMDTLTPTVDVSWHERRRAEQEAKRSEMRELMIGGAWVA